MLLKFYSVLFTYQISNWMNCTLFMLDYRCSSWPCSRTFRWRWPHSTCTTCLLSGSGGTSTWCWPSLRSETTSGTGSGCSPHLSTAAPSTGSRSAFWRFLLKWARWLCPFIDWFNLLKRRVLDKYRKIFK